MQLHSSCTALTNTRRRKPSGVFLKPRFLLLAVLGGSIGAWMGMKVWHHKTMHKKFKYGIPAILLIQIALMAYFHMNLWKQIVWRKLWQWQLIQQTSVRIFKKSCLNLREYIILSGKPCRKMRSWQPWFAHDSFIFIVTVRRFSFSLARLSRRCNSDVGNENAMEQEHYSDSEYVAWFLHQCLAV